MTRFGGAGPLISGFWMAGVLMKTRHFVGAMAVFGVVAAWGIASRGQGPAPKDGNPFAGNPFAGKFLVVTVDVPHESFTEYLRDAEVREVGGRSFLVGTNALSQEEFWSGEARLWIGVNAISTITECRDEEDFRKRYKKSLPADPPAPAPLPR